MLSTGKCDCGRDQLPVLRELTGRSEDAIVARDGRQIVRFHGLFIDLPNVLEGQVIQEMLDFVRVRVLARPGFDNPERQLICQRLQERLGRIRVEVEPVSRIERTARGTFRAVISLLRTKAAREFDASSHSRSPDSANGRDNHNVCIH